MVTSRLTWQAHRSKTDMSQFDDGAASGRIDEQRGIRRTLSQDETVLQESVSNVSELGWGDPDKGWEADWEVRRERGAIFYDGQQFEKKVEQERRLKEWSREQLMVARVLEANFKGSHTNIFDTIMGVIIVLNVVLMVYETDKGAVCYKTKIPRHSCFPDWVTVFNMLLLVIYTVEVVMRLFVFRLAFFRSKWNLLDFTIVVMGIVNSSLSSMDGELQKVNILRMLRMGRVLRVAKILKRIKTLSQMIAGFVYAMQAMSWGLVLILILLIIWSMLAVELVQSPMNSVADTVEPWCLEAFSSVWHATVFFFQTLVAGDSWGACTVPVILATPPLFILFALALVSVQLGFTNLVLAIIVDRAADAREGTKDEQKAKRKAEELHNFECWRNLMSEMDDDDSGTISLEELIQGSQRGNVLKALEDMNVEMDDMITLFFLMDSGNGNLGYDQLIDSLHKALTQDPRIYLMMIKSHIVKNERFLHAVVGPQVKAIARVVNQMQTRIGRRGGGAARKKDGRGGRHIQRQTARIGHLHRAEAKEPLILPSLTSKTIDRIGNHSGMPSNLASGEDSTESTPRDSGLNKTDDNLRETAKSLESHMDCPTTTTSSGRSGLSSTIGLNYISKDRRRRTMFAEEPCRGQTMRATTRPSLMGCESKKSNSPMTNMANEFCDVVKRELRMFRVSVEQALQEGAAQTSDQINKHNCVIEELVQAAMANYFDDGLFTDFSSQDDMDDGVRDSTLGVKKRKDDSGVDRGRKGRNIRQRSDRSAVINEEQTSVESITSQKNLRPVKEILKDLTQQRGDGGMEEVLADKHQRRRTKVEQMINEHMREQENTMATYDDKTSMVTIEPPRSMPAPDEIPEPDETDLPLDWRKPSRDESVLFS